MPNTHIWIQLKGSNVSFQCEKCGIIGSYDLHSVSLVKVIHPKMDDSEGCDLRLIKTVMEN